MAAPILATKLYIPPPRSKVVLRPRLAERLNEGLGHKLTLISAPAGFGKTTLVSEWVAGCEHPVAWLSLDEGDKDPARFLSYLVSALQTIVPGIGEGVLGALQSPQPPSLESILIPLLNEIATVPHNFALVLDDYHVIDAKPVDKALTLLLEHLPPQMHLAIVTREDPDLPLTRLRAGDQLTELRVTDLRFTFTESAEFLRETMGLHLSTEDIADLETRTEGWVVGLQLAAISMQGVQDTASFIKSFTGSHHFVLDYLLEEALQKQPDSIQTFLLRTSILERMCGPLCDALLTAPAGSGQKTLEHLEQINMFIIPLDNERRWYRYHHLFADLLRQRLLHSASSSAGDEKWSVDELHKRASTWYEDNGLQIEAFKHAAAANDIERAERLIDGKGIPLHLSGGVTPILDWLASLPTEVMNARPWLWWRHAALLLINGQTIGVQEKLNAAEAALAAALQGGEADEKTRNWIGRIAGARSVLALTRYDVKTMFTQSRRALEYLPPGNPAARTTPLWTLGYAHFLHGDRAAARQAYTEAISLSQASGDMFTTILATIGLGNVQELDNQLYQAAETYRRILQWVGDKPQQIIHEAHLGLARILYEWNDLDAAEQHGEQSLHLARQYEQIIDRYVVCEVFLARLKLAQGDVAEATAILSKADESVRQQNFVHRVPEVASAQVLTLLRQGNIAAAAHLAQSHNLPISQARVRLAQGDTPAALAVLERWHQQVEEKGWKDEQLKVMVLQALILNVLGEKDKALQVLGDSLALAEAAGFIRIFVDEGAPMAHLLSEALTHGMMPDYVAKLLAAFEAEKKMIEDKSPLPSDQPLIEPLSQRELEVLQLVAQGLSNDEIGKRLFLALDTVKGHNRRIYDKLQVQRRTEAVARARELGLL
jgi:LuxR family transcriptional regulator, maltose regulon positive regulatory protein